ncbi:hypothetical protein A2714_03900 [Candidatus Woesebacteria bacterium RIFCSPHIGHO2_01_FULL_38_9]|uniref:Polysaccharide pyruvyl transferase domain-containing protein n=2 Tax=Candidatus Woeseibacteriota TaxID=1752722 RepID=A0A1F7XZR9_9BACT|nr:MAG: hypothetical protein A2714_03900 [Candidatus Woesebacteria bacterium RIFCSPHIGHO2_01_FULL_38_9]OGM60054.1 MAG: hypothetical protein A3A75_01470 [Candidatus Woesebacteria bacterium RIFCSPLOWO2_01_FULL_39_10]
MNILIPNATGPTNLGDHTMLEVLLDLIESTKGKKKLMIHTKNPELYERKYARIIAPSIYHYVALSKINLIVRTLRMIKILMYSQIVKNRSRPFISKRSDTAVKIMNDYIQADVIIFAGGGYLRSQKGMRQSLNLLLQLVPFIVAKSVKRKIIVAPNSFGPFAYHWQLKLTAKVLNDCDVVAVREEKSYTLMKSYGVKNLHLLNDLALLVKKTKPTNKKNKIIGFTIRNWLRSRVEQDKLEFSYAHALTRLSKRTGVTIQPIIQVASPDFPFEDDKEAVRRVYNRLRDGHVPVSVPIKLKSVKHAANVYGCLDLLLGMRMHSNILAATQGVPFVAVSYEHKTHGITKQIGMEKYCISCEKIDGDVLYKLLMVVYRNRKRLRDQLITNVASIRSIGINEWQSLLSKTN